jgi:hypothetical protein
MKGIINDHHKGKLIEKAQLKQQEAMDKFKKLPVLICSKGCVEFTPVELFKRESAISSASGTEEITPIASHRCNVCQKLLPYASQIGGIPDIFISSCKMHTTDDPDLISIISDYVITPDLKQWMEPESKNDSDSIFKIMRQKLHNFFTRKH